MKNVFLEIVLIKKKINPEKSKLMTFGSFFLHVFWCLIFSELVSQKKQKKMEKIFWYLEPKKNTQNFEGSKKVKKSREKIFAIFLRNENLCQDSLWDAFSIISLYFSWSEKIIYHFLYQKSFHEKQ